MSSLKWTKIWTSPVDTKYTHTKIHTHPTDSQKVNSLRLSVWSKDLCSWRLVVRFIVRCVCLSVNSNVHVQKYLMDLIMVIYLVHSKWLYMRKRCVSIKVFRSCNVWWMQNECVWRRDGLSEAPVCPYLLVMDTDARGQASMEQGARVVCLTPSCCPNPGRGCPEGQWALQGSGSPSACITLNINTHC